GRLVGPARCPQDVGPDDLGAAQDLRDEPGLGVVAWWRRRRALLLDDLPAAATAAHQPEKSERVDAEDPAGDERHHNAAEADAATAETAAAAAHAANVFDVAALVLAVHPHRRLPAWRRARPPALRSSPASRLAAHGTCGRGPCSSPRRPRASRRR